MRLQRSVLGLTAVLVAAGCGVGGGGAAPTTPPASGSPPVSLPDTPVTVTVTVPPGLATAPYEVARQLTVPTGWTATVYARIPGARFMSATPDGAVLVSQPSTGQVTLVRRAAGGVGQVSTFIRGLNKPHDIVFAELAGRTWMFIAEADRVVRYPYTVGSTTAPTGEVVVDGLPDTSTPELRGQYAHVLKNIAVHDGSLYVSIASTCNVCESDTVSDPERATIYRYDAAGHNSGRSLYARGLRNAEGLAFLPGTSDLWVVVNNRDNIRVPDDRDVDGDGTGDKGKLMAGYVDNHPPEEFIHLTEGGFYGWPFCNPNTDNGTRNMPYDRDYELNRDGRAADCATAKPVTVGIQAHSAPLGLTFVPNLGAVIALHGSWNSTKPVGYKVIFFPFTTKGPGEQQDLATGFLGQDGKAWGRPVDTVVDTDGSILISDDLGGALIRLAPRS